MMPHKTYISLTGGLGNQLFQLAAALTLTPTSTIVYDSLLGRPRLNSEGLPEVLSYRHVQKVQGLNKKKFSWLASKSIGYHLRKGISPKPYEELAIYGFLTKLFSLLPLVPYFRNVVWPSVSSDIGYDNVNVKKGNNLFIGYFQSYKWVSTSETLTLFQNMKLRENSLELERYRELARIEKPLIVHVRLGDYIGHNDFGIPSPEYFSGAIQAILSKGIVENIWLFSDDLDKAISYVPKVENCSIRLIPEVDDSASVTLEVMKLGLAYVISNSTFSWWGAYLAHYSNAEVIAPLPWFKSIPEPLELIPPEWTRHAAWPNT